MSEDNWLYITIIVLILAFFAVLVSVLLVTASCKTTAMEKGYTSSEIAQLCR